MENRGKIIEGMWKCVFTLFPTLLGERKFVILKCRSIPLCCLWGKKKTSLTSSSSLLVCPGFVFIFGFFGFGFLKRSIKRLYFGQNKFKTWELIIFFNLKYDKKKFLHLQTYVTKHFEGPRPLDKLIENEKKGRASACVHVPRQMPMLATAFCVVQLSTWVESHHDQVHIGSSYRPVVLKSSNSSWTTAFFRSNTFLIWISDCPSGIGTELLI